MKNSILNINVSCFEKCTGTSPADVNLLSWLTSDKYRERVEQLRSIQDEDLQKTIKKSLPAITPAGLFSYRDEKHLIEHSGFLAFDIDFADNEHISNFNELKEQISHVVCVAYCGLSVRGKGFWGLIPIPKSTPEEHKYRFNALSKFFKGYNINLDPSGSDVCRLRIYSWDPEGYFNHNAKIYTSILKPQAKKSTRPAYTDTRERVEAIISKIKADKFDITQDYKEGWLKIASALANEFGESGRNYFHAVSQYHAKYDVSETDRVFDNVLKHDYSKISIGSFFKIASDYGIKIQEGQRKGEIAKPSENQSNLVTNGNRVVKTLPELGISRKEVTTLPKVEKTVKPGIWSSEITELEQFFKTVKLPSGSIQLDSCSKITDLPLFVESHLSVLKAQNGNMRYKPYLDRLKEVKRIMSN
jgi:VirE N-terminal domain/Primase C terminal 2 (PriCT-2)